MLSRLSDLHPDPSAEPEEDSQQLVRVSFGTQQVLLNQSEVIQRVRLEIGQTNVPGFLDELAMTLFQD